MYGLKDCAYALALKRGLPKSEAMSIMTDVVDVLKEAILEDKGVVFKGLFTITRKIRKGRTGVFKGHEWKTEDKMSLTITVGSDLDKEMNPGKVCNG